MKRNTDGTIEMTEKELHGFISKAVKEAIKEEPKKPGLLKAFMLGGMEKVTKTRNEYENLATSRLARLAEEEKAEEIQKEIGKVLKDVDPDALMKALSALKK